MTFPAFKAGDSALRGPNGGFDFHTPPPITQNEQYTSVRSIYVNEKKVQDPGSTRLRAINAVDDALAKGADLPLSALSR